MMGRVGEGVGRREGDYRGDLGGAVEGEGSCSLGGGLERRD